MSYDSSYGPFVAARFNRLSGFREALAHAAVGVAGEAGEILDCVKKNWAYNQPLDLGNLVEELGDMEFYLEALRQEIGISRETILELNMEKLSKRFPDGYSDAAAAARADKDGQSS